MRERRGPTDAHPTRKNRRQPHDVTVLMQAGLFAQRVGPPKGPQPFRFYRPARRFWPRGLPSMIRIIPYYGRR